MKIHSINERMPYTACLHEVSSENDKKVRRFHLGHLLFTVQLHSWEVEDFDKKSIMAKEELIKEKLPKKIRESLSNANHKYDSQLTADLTASADKIHVQLEKLQKMKAEAEAAKTEAETAKAEADAKAKAEAEADAKAAAEAEALTKMIDEMLTARGVPAASPDNGQQPDVDAAAKAKAAEEAAKAKAAEEKKLRDATDAAKAEVEKLKAKLNDEKLTGAARDAVNEKYRKALEAYFSTSGKLASFINATL